MRGGNLILVAVLALAAIIYWNSSARREVTQSPTRREAPNQNCIDSSATFDGYDCTADCSGHEAGYRWAEEHDIADGDTCDTAGEHSSSPSFAEGCRAYVDGDQPDLDGSGNDKDDDSGSDD